MTMEKLHHNWNKLYQLREGWQLYGTVPSAERQVQTAFGEPVIEAGMDVQEPPFKPCLSRLWTLLDL